MSTPVSWGRASRLPRQSPVDQITDDFAGSAANLNTHTTTTGGLTWASVSGTLNLSGSGTVTNGSGTTTVYTLAAALVDCTASAELTIGTGTNSQPGVILRYQDGSNFFAATVVYSSGTTGTLRILRNLAGSLTIPATAVVTYVAGQRLYLTAYGSLIRAVYGPTRVAIIDTNLSSANKVGIWGSAAAGLNVWDNYLVTVP